MRPFLREDHEVFRETARRFVEKEISPFLHEWEAAGIVPKALWLKASAAGLLCATVPEAYGGAGGQQVTGVPYKAGSRPAAASCN